MLSNIIIHYVYNANSVDIVYHQSSATKNHEISPAVCRVIFYIYI